MKEYADQIRNRINEASEKAREGNYVELEIYTALGSLTKLRVDILDLKRIGFLTAEEVRELRGNLKGTYDSIKQKLPSN